METVSSADGTTIAYERTGSGPPLVLVHGTTADHTRWEPVLPAFEERFTVYAMDRRGRGGSGDVAELRSAGQPDAAASGDAETYELEREFEDVAAVVDAVGEPVVLLGHSYGALCSLEAALRTDAIRALVLYEPPLPVGEHALYSEDTNAEMAALIDEGRDEEALLVFFREVVGAPPAELEALRSAPNWPARVAAVRTVLREEPAPAAYEFDPDRFAALTTPTLLLAGSESAPFLRDSTAALAATLPNCRVVVLEGHGHAAMNTAPEEFVEAVLEFDRETRAVRGEQR